MTSEADQPFGELEAWSMPVKAGDGPRLMGEVTAAAARAGTEVLVLDGAMVFGKDHLRSALYHATRALEDGTNSSESILMETLLYASGERQLSAAIKKMSVSEATSELVVARLTAGDFEPGPGWETVPNRPQDLNRERLLRFGVSEEELGTVSPETASDIVLEKVAAVDIVKR